MRITLFRIVISLAFCTPAMAQEQQTDPAPANMGGLYFSGEIALGGARKTGAPGIYEASTNYASSLSGGIGYRMGPVRAEAQLRYEHFDISSMNPVAGSPMASPETAVDFDGWGIMGNLFYDFRSVGDVRPYLGGGIGFVNMNANASDMEICFIVCIKETPEVTGSDTVMAWQAMAGMVFPTKWDFGEWRIGYRYYRTEDMTFDLAGYGPFVQEGLESHSVAIGLHFFIP